VDEVVTVLCDAFHDYPVMRHVIGPAPEDHAGRLRTLIEYFVARRVLRNEPMIGIDDASELVAVAIMTPPGRREAPPALAEQRERVWSALGDAARERYEHLSKIWQRVAITEPNLHLNLIGVRGKYAGCGLGRRLLDHVHDMSLADPESAGVTLTTENPDNVRFYEHFGYRQVRHELVADGLETWWFFRPDVG
jgi:GNAT superfamily N-acetyltransferase